jgi:PAS domain S-box-containing protein
MDSVRVLFVAPEPGSPERTATRLGKIGAEATAVTAETGAEATAYLEREPVDCVVAPADLPETEGLALLERVRESTPDLPFVLVGDDTAGDVASDVFSRSLAGYVGSADDPTLAVAGWVRRLVEQRRARTEAANRRRLESVVRDVHRAVTRSASRREIERGICEVLTEFEPYRFAWIAAVDDETGEVVERAAAGVEGGYLDEIVVTSDAAATARGPTGRALQTGDTHVVRNVSDDASYGPWRTAALDRGYRSTAAIPLTFGDDSYGVLNVYANRVDAFDDTELDLLADVADGAGFAIHARETRAALEASEQRYSSIVEAVSDGIIIAQDATIRFVNGTLAEMSGYERDDLLGEPILRFVAPEYHDELMERHRERLRGAASGEPYEIALVSNAGDRIPVEISAAPFEYEGRPATVTIVRDISERRDYQQRLARTNRRLHEQRAYTDRILDSIDDVFFIVGTDARLRWWNRAARDLWGYTDAEARSTPITEFFRDDEAERIRENFETVLNRGVTRTEVTVVTGEGEEIPHEFVANVLEDSDGDRIVAGTGRDITARTERERQLQVIDRVLRHNLHNDMSVIMGHAEEVSRLGDDSVGGHATKIIERSEQLLATARKERAVVEILLEKPSPATVDLGSVVRSTVDSAREKHDDVRVRTSVPDDTTVFAIADVETALAELIDNAIRHTDRETPEIEVTAERRDGAVELRVADDGPGIPEQERKVLTRERDIEPLYHGSGLGLWLVHWIVDHSGGTLRFERSEPRGSVVVLELPTTDADPSTDRDA